MKSFLLYAYTTLTRFPFTSLLIGASSPRQNHVNRGYLCRYGAGQPVDEYVETLVGVADFQWREPLNWYYTDAYERAYACEV